MALPENCPKDGGVGTFRFTSVAGRRQALNPQGLATLFCRCNQLPTYRSASHLPFSFALTVRGRAAAKHLRRPSTGGFPMFRTLMIGAVSALTLSAAAFAQRRFRLIIAGAALASIFAGLPISTVEAQCFAEGMPVLRLDDNGNPVIWNDCSFTSLMDQTLFTLNGLLYRVENASQPWSCEQYDTNLFRFELRSGDIWPNPGGFTERTEISAGGVLYPPGTVVTITYNFTLEPGPTNIAPWLVIGQWHSTYMPTAPQPDHPPVGLFLMGDDRLQVLGVWAETGSTTENDMT